MNMPIGPLGSKEPDSRPPTRERVEALANAILRSNGPSAALELAQAVVDFFAPDRAPEPANGLKGTELAQLHSQMGIRPRIIRQFERTPEGGLRIHNVGPRAARELARRGGSR
jgi:hypothetical protein